MSILFVLAWLLTTTTCKEDYVGQVWLTTADGQHKFSRHADAKFRAHCEGQRYVIDVDDSVENETQTIHGFGVNIHGDILNAVCQKIPRVSQSKMMKELFDPQGVLRLNILKVVFGPSDGSSNRTFDDTCCTLQGQFRPVHVKTFRHLRKTVNLADFTIERDKECVIPMLKLILEVNRNVSIVGTFYTPPDWMKLRNESSLNQSRWIDYSLYVALTVEAYQEHGVPIYGVSIQNTPTQKRPEVPGMLIDSKTEAKVLHEYLKWAFNQFKLKTKILVGEDDWSKHAYHIDVLKRVADDDLILGSSFHCASGDSSAQLNVHSAFPTKEIWITDCADSDLTNHSSKFGDSFLTAVKKVMIEGLRNYANGVVKFNFRLKNSTSKNVTWDNRESEYVSTVHFSRLVQRGAKRLQSTRHENAMDTIAFKNPNGDVVLVLLNELANETMIRVNYGLVGFDYYVPGKSVITVRWTPDKVRTTNPFGQIEAEGFSKRLEVDFSPCNDSSGCGSSASPTRHGQKHYLLFRNVDFGSFGADYVEIRASGGLGDAVLFSVGNVTDQALKLEQDDGRFRVLNRVIPEITGLQDVYVYLQRKVRLNWFRFGRNLNLRRKNPYKIVSYNSDFSLDVYNKGNVSGTPIVQWEFYHGYNQEFYFQKTGFDLNQYSIKDGNSDLCLEPRKGDHFVVLAICDPEKLRQRWVLVFHPNQLQPDGSFLYNFLNVGTQLALFASQEKGSNVKVIQYACGMESQLFKLSLA